MAGCCEHGNEPAVFKEVDTCSIAEHLLVISFYYEF
jgi:hypothetical protein